MFAHSSPVHSVCVDMFRGDGWEGSTMEITSCTGEVLATGLTVTDGFYKFETECFPFDLSGFIVEVGGGSYESEIYWQITMPNGSEETGYAGSTTIGECPEPTAKPTGRPTRFPSSFPVTSPTNAPGSPTKHPAPSPTKQPKSISDEPTHAPSTIPTHLPTADTCATDGEMKFVVHMSDSWCGSLKLEYTPR